MTLSVLLTVKENDYIYINDFKYFLKLHLDYKLYVYLDKQKKNDKYDFSDLGLIRQRLINKCTSEFILFLDIDEMVSGELAEEIRNILNHPDPDISGYRIPYLNHFLGKPLVEAAEQYSKIRLFRRKKARFPSALVHEDVVINGKVALLSGKILHYSYRSLPQVIRKFTDYARREARQKRVVGERVTLKKLFLYAPHMFFARFIKSGGYLDGWRGFLLSALFAYMEFATYFFLSVYSVWPRKNRKNSN